MFRDFKTGLRLLLFMIILTGCLYPLLITLIAQTLLPWQANGSLIEKAQQPIGSYFIGQSFTTSRYFWGRPSATSPLPYNASASTGANFGPMNPSLLSTIKARATHLSANHQAVSPLPMDLLTDSASGLDPDISSYAAYYQVPRIAAERQLSEHMLYALIDQHTQPRTFGFLGEPRVNVLQLNLALDDIVP